MRKILVLALLCLTILVGPAHAASGPDQSATVYQLAEKSWAVGTMVLGTPLPFREGKVLVFPTQISDLLWAPNQTKPRNLMLVYEVGSHEKDKPFFQSGDEIFAPIRLLPDHSYWKDNLPATRRHAVAGGRRYAFRGADAVEAKKILAAYLTATDIRTAERWSTQVAAVAAGLGSPVAVLREDSVAYLSAYPFLARDVDAKALPAIEAFLAGDAPIEQKTTLASALVAAKAVQIQPMLTRLSSRDDATGALALSGLDHLGEVFPTDRLLALSRASSPEVRAYAAAALGRRAGTDEAAFARAKELLDSAAEPVAVRAAAADGMGVSAGEKACAVLAAATARGDEGSRGAAKALAASGNPKAGELLVDVLKSTDGEAAIAAVAALGQMKSCIPCETALREQHKSHKDESVRDLIGVVLEVPLVHKH